MVSFMGSAALPVAAAAAESEGFKYSAKRVFAVGDVHGAYDRLVQLLQANQLIDGDNHWSGAEAHLASLGDLMLDRSPRSRDVMDQFRRLQGEARTAGGHVHVLLGNHEVMNPTGDLRDVSEAEFAAFAVAAEGPKVVAGPLTPDGKPVPPGYAQHRRAFAPNGEYGRWLMSLPLLIQINDTYLPTVD